VTKGRKSEEAGEPLERETLDVRRKGGKTRRQETYPSGKLKDTPSRYPSRIYSGLFARGSAKPTDIVPTRSRGGLTREEL